MPELLHDEEGIELPGEQENLDMLESAIESLLQDVYDDTDMTDRIKHILALYEERVVLFKRRMTDMLVLMRDIQKQAGEVRQTNTKLTLDLRQANYQIKKYLE